MLGHRFRPSLAIDQYCWILVMTTSANPMLKQRPGDQSRCPGGPGAPLHASAWLHPDEGFRRRRRGIYCSPSKASTATGDMRRRETYRRGCVKGSHHLSGYSSSECRASNGIRHFKDLHFKEHPALHIRCYVSRCLQTGTQADAVQCSSYVGEGPLAPKEQ